SANEASSAPARFAGAKTAKPGTPSSLSASSADTKTAATPVSVQPAAIKTADLSQQVRGQYALDSTTTHSARVAEDAGGATQPMSETPEPATIAPSGPCGGQCGCAYGPGQSGAHYICGVDCGNCGAPCCATWKDARCIPWSFFGPGEYVGPARPAHVSTYY